ncbi:hypothetical protein [Pelagicoccus sp. SDUM812005]|uniref:hypothetical protein n=1 Tax=Pelagicoccus sp. SDUM812005 TaxID=3041257 RepID=UPI00280F706F|nr:hypothetical protein [Pelagicoccus sp. SDUM812005]MDQ8181776.1 hypothetical protein [Pelagicoccus sp. SDUM812005]
MILSDPTMPGARYRNIIVVNEEPSIHASFDLYLQPDETEIATASGNADESLVLDFADTRNFSILHADEGNSAVQIASKRATGNRPIQVAFIDLKTGNLDGTETIKLLQEANPRIIFAITSSNPPEALETISDALGPVPVEIVAKPLDGETVHRVAARMCCRWEQLHGL